MRTIAGLLLVAAVTLSAQNVPQSAEEMYVTAVEVVADVRDAKGKVPDGLKPADFVVTEDGVQRTIVGVEYLRAARGAAATVKPLTTGAPATAAATPAALPRPVWQNVLYFESTLANSTGRISAAKKMLEHVDHLVAMGTVDVVFANPTPAALVRNSRDAAAIRAALQKIIATGGTNQLAANRRQFSREVGTLASTQALGTQDKRYPLRLDMDKRPEITPNENPNYMTMDNEGREEQDGTRDPLRTTTANALRPYIEQEVMMISDFRDSLIAWLSSYRRHVPRNLLMVTDGFDLDPVEFYGASAPNSALMELRTYVSQTTLGSSAGRMAEALVAGAWTTISIPSDNYSDGWVDDSTVSGIGRANASHGKKPVGAPKAFFVRPHDPLNAIAEVTGGSVVPNSSKLGDLLAGLDDRVKLTYQVDRRPDGKPRRVEVRAQDPKLNVRTARFAMSSTPDAIAETRAVGLLKSATYQGDLMTEGAMEWTTTAGPNKSGMLRALTQVELVKRLLPAGAKGQFRITLAIQMGKEAVIVNRAVPDYDMKDGVFRFRTPLDLPVTASKVVLVIEETTTGAWGSARIDVTPPAS